MPSSSSARQPVTPDPPREEPRPLLTQSWLDLAFIHWALPPEQVVGLLPAGTAPDTIDGLTYVGLVPFRMHRVGLWRLPGIPYLGTFPETNVRLYSVDGQGRRGVVFRSLDAARLLPAVVGRAAFGLPYFWSQMSIMHSGDTVTYTSRRRWPEPKGAHSTIGIRIGAPIAQPTPLEHFLTARWGLHTGGGRYLPNTHPRWTLHRAALTECTQDLIHAAGLPQPVGDPVSVLYSPGVPVRFGRSHR